MEVLKLTKANSMLCHSFISLQNGHAFTGLNSACHSFFDVAQTFLEKQNCNQRLLRKAPYVCEFEVTNHCSFAKKFGPCLYCYASAYDKLEDELLQEQRCELIRKLGTWGVSVLIIGGGEPFDIGVDNLIELFEVAKKQNMYVYLSTSGIVCNGNIAKRLASLGIDGVSVSLDGPTEVIHAKTRSSRETFNFAVNAVREFVNAGIKTSISTVISRYNFDTFNELVEFAQNLGVFQLYTIPLILTGRGRNLFNMALTEAEKKVHIIRSIQKNKELRGNFKVEVSSPQKNVVGNIYLLPEFTNSCLGCTAGFSDIGLLSDGTMVDCPIHRRKIINITNLPVEELKLIWESHSVFTLLREKRNNHDNKLCGSCKHLLICGGCQAELETMSGEKCVFFEARDKYQF